MVLACSKGGYVSKKVVVFCLMDENSELPGTSILRFTSQLTRAFVSFEDRVSDNCVLVRGQW